MKIHPNDVENPRDRQDRLAEEALIGASVAHVPPPDPPTPPGKPSYIPCILLPFLATAPHARKKETFPSPKISTPILSPK